MTSEHLQNLELVPRIRVRLTKGGSLPKA